MGRPAGDRGRPSSPHRLGLVISRAGLPQDAEVPLIVYVGRLDSQKGADLILQAVPWIMEQRAQLICLGTGEPALEDGMRWMEATYRNQGEQHPDRGTSPK